MQDRNNTLKTVSHWYNIRFKIILDSIIIGILTGLSIVLIRVIIQKSEFFQLKVYYFLKTHLWYIPLLFIILAAIGYCIGLIIKKEPMVRGSGVPQVEGVLLRKLSMSWWKVFIYKTIGAILSIGAGLSLGREGPSIQIGAAIGMGYSKTLRRVKVHENFLITSGASAGLAAAFNAPLAGVMFALEEVHKNFSSLILLGAVFSAISADFVSKEFFGLKPIFTFTNINVLPLNHYGYIILLGLILGAFGALFNSLLLKTKDLYVKQKWLPVQIRPIIPLLLAGIFGLFLPQVLGGGQDIIVSLTGNINAVKFLIVLLVVKFLFTIFSYGSGAPGGIFMPLLVIGAITGNLVAILLSSVFNFQSAYINTFAVLAMAGYFAAIVKAPITGIVLITEMTGTFSHILPLSIVVMTSYIISTLLGSKPIYESLLERSLVNEEYDEFKGDKKTKIILEIAVCTDSNLDGKMIKEVIWPPDSLLIGIKKGESEIIPKGNTIINAGDYIVVLVQEENAEKAKSLLTEIADHCIIQTQSQPGEFFRNFLKKILIFLKLKKH
ncbi:MAG: ClC family H(+)/Cl(-) exchange transporter [Candidatus Humimicrobiaceae bacterium]